MKRVLLLSGLFGLIFLGGCPGPTSDDANSTDENAQITQSPICKSLKNLAENCPEMEDVPKLGDSECESEYKHITGSCPEATIEKVAKDFDCYATACDEQAEECQAEKQATRDLVNACMSLSSNDSSETDDVFFTVNPPSVTVEGGGVNP